MFILMFILELETRVEGGAIIADIILGEMMRIRYLYDILLLLASVF